MATLTVVRSRGLVLTAVVAALLAVTSLFAPVAPAGAADRQDSSRLDSFAACLSAEKAGDIVLLLDESGSLGDTDPQHARVAAAKQLIDQWADLPVAGITLDARIAAFGDDVSWVGDWTSLNPETLPAVTRDVESFTVRTQGQKTDYWRALDAADRELARRRGETGHRCQAIVWFTDGKLDVAAGVAGQDDSSQPYLDGARVDDATATKRAAADLCRPGGRADQLRGRNIALFGIGLEPTPGSGDFNLMRGIVTGVDGCGSRTTPTPGYFQTAKDMDALLRAFFRLGTPTGSPAPDSTAGVCAAAPCPNAEQHAIALDPAITSVNVFVTHPATATLRLTPPAAAAVALTPADSAADAAPQTIGGAQLTSVRRSPTSTTIRMAWPDATAKPGVWRLAVLDPQAPKGSRSIASIIVSSDLEPGATMGATPLADAPAVSGTSLQATISLQRRGVGSAVPVPDGAKVTAGLVLPDGTLTSLGELDAAALRAGSTVTASLPDDATGRAALRLGLAISITADGVTTALAPRSVDVPFTITAPPGRPQFPEVVDFGQIDSTDSVKSDLAVRGTGCVWLAGAPTVQAAPEGVGATVTADSGAAKGDCVPAGPEASLPLTLTPTIPGMGGIDGTLPIGYVDENGQTHETTVAFVAQLTKPVDGVRFTIAFFLALALGVGIPLGLLYLVKWRATRIPSLPLVAQTIPVTVRDGRVLRDGSPLADRASDLRHLVPMPVGGARGLNVGDLRLRAVVGKSPLGAGVVQVEHPGNLVVTSYRTYPRRDAGYGLLPLAVHNTWVLSHDLEGAPDEASLTLFAAADATPSQREGLYASASDRVPDAFARVRPEQPASVGAYSLTSQPGSSDADAVTSSRSDAAASGGPDAQSGRGARGGSATDSARPDSPRSDDGFRLWDE